MRRHETGNRYPATGPYMGRSQTEKCVLEKTHKIAQRATALAQWCTSWRRQPRACVRNLGTNPRGIMCLLDGVLLGIQASWLMVHQRLLFASFFSDYGASNHAPPTMGRAVVLSSIVTAIPLRWWRTMARSKAHDLLHRSAWSAVDRAANNIANMATSLAPSNLRRDSKAPGRS